MTAKNHADDEAMRCWECGAELRPADADAADHLPLSVIAAAGHAAGRADPGTSAG